ncbi:MAG: 30S ribosomal protein S6 [Candidatus Peregrinibacteria bacterium]
MKNYETLFLFPSDLAETAAQKAFEEIKKQIADNYTGTISFSEWWGKRALAYKIGSFTTGFYALLQYSFPPEKMVEFDEELRLLPKVLRFLTTLAPEGDPLPYSAVVAEDRAFAEEKSAGKRRAKKRPSRIENLKSPSSSAPKAKMAPLGDADAEND